MKTGMKAAAVVASVLALGMVSGQASADDIINTVGDDQVIVVDIDNSIVDVDFDDLTNIVLGDQVVLSADTDQTANSNNNSVYAGYGGKIINGAVEIKHNSQVGGISMNMGNTGHNAILQQNMNVNVFFAGP